MIKVAPSILSADFANLSHEIKEVEKYGADLLHIDVMDGHFVPNITIGPVVVSAIKKNTKLPLDVHLMIEDPDRYIPQFVQSGADIISIHAETVKHLHRTISLIKELGAKVSVALNPHTPLAIIDLVLAELDMVLLMSVNPGFGGQKFIPFVLEKIEQLAKLKEDRKLHFAIEVDGGINKENAKIVAKAGATILVAGNAIFQSEDRESVVNFLKNPF